MNIVGYLITDGTTGCHTEALICDSTDLAVLKTHVDFFIQQNPNLDLDTLTVNPILMPIDHTAL